MVLSIAIRLPLSHGPLQIAKYALIALLKTTVDTQNPNQEKHNSRADQLRYIASASQQVSSSSANETNPDGAEVTAKPKRKFWPTLFHLVVYTFALAGFGIIGAWAFYQLGGTKNKGGVDENRRYLMSAKEMDAIPDSTLTHQQVNDLWMRQYAKLAAFGKFYPENARLILEAAQRSGDPMLVDRMMAAISSYADDADDYQAFMKKVEQTMASQKQQENGNIIPWMDTPEWGALKQAILKDSALLIKASVLTGVEPRLIVSCLVGEQIRLFNSKREMFKRYLGPVKVLSVQSQFSWGVNGIKEFTAIAVEDHLKDPQSEFYMGKRYENILDFETNDHSNERFRRLVDYRNHLYSYIYTGCIIHQTMLQWKRAGFDISNRPDILCTLFNVGFSQSHPHANPVCGGSHVSVDGRLYTFGTIGYDFYYSGELANTFPYWRESFIADDGKALSEEDIKSIQDNMSNCSRPEKGIEYRQDSSALPDGVINDGGNSSSNSQLQPAYTTTLTY